MGKAYPLFTPGDQFGNWTVEKFCGVTGRYHRTYDCLCACGHKQQVLGYQLRSGKSTQCKKCASAAAGLKHRKAGSTRAINALFRMHQLGAHARGIGDELNKRQWVALAKQPCHYCGVVDSNCYCRGQHCEFGYNGIDRVDNTKGYTPENSVPCCHVCNRMKLDQTHAAFMKQIHRIIKHGSTKE